MNLIDLPTAPAKPAAELIAEHMLARLNATLAERVHDHRVGYAAFWDSSETPDAIIAAMGTNAGVLLAAAGENVDHIGTLAALAGKTVVDFLPLENWVPRRAIIIAEDGTGTLAAPAEGFDAWGRAIPAPEEITENPI